jgi:hypothetical protein
MKPLPLLLTVSLAANAALLAVFAIRPALAPPAVRDWFTSDVQRAADAANAAKATEAKVAAQTKAAAAKKAGVWASLQADDLKTLVDHLRAAGFSPAIIRAIVMAKVDAIFSSRMSELVGLLDVPYWKAEIFSSQSKYYEASNQIYRDRTKTVREILGDDYFADSVDLTADQRRRFGDLAKSKVTVVQRIVDDYDEMSSQVKTATQGVMLPEDRAKLALLEKEKHADLAAILTPEELEDFEMRNNQQIYRYTEGLNIMNASEAEFRAIYRAQQPYADILFPTGPSSVPYAQVQEARAAANEQIKAALGSARYADYQRATDYDYQSLWRAAQRENLSNETVNRAYDLRQGIATESMRIRENQALSDAERDTALKALAVTAKNQYIGILGSTATDVYAQNGWLGALAKGWAIRLEADGRMIFMNPPPTQRPAPTTTPSK